MEEQLLQTFKSVYINKFAIQLSAPGEGTTVAERDILVTSTAVAEISLFLSIFCILNHVRLEAFPYMFVTSSFVFVFYSLLMTERISY